MKSYIPQLLLTLAIISYSLLGFTQTSSPSVNIANWQGNKKAAVCVTLDDGCDQQFVVGKHVMDSLGIKGTFFIITNLNSNCDGGQGANPPMTIYNGKGSPEYWDTLQNTINQGHEIGAHTVHHPELASIYNKYGIDSVTKELSMSKATLEQELHEPGQDTIPYKVLTFAYPYGSGQDNKHIIDSVQKYFIAARAAGTYDSVITWDTYANAKNPTSNGFINYWYQVESYAATDTMSNQWFSRQLDSTIKYAGWFNAMYHNIGGTSLDADLYSVSPSNFRAQMEAIVAQKNNLWVAPFRDVVRYNKETASSTAKVKTSDSLTTVISLTDTIKNPAFCVPLTLLVSNFTCTCSIDSIKQAENILSFCTPTTSQIQFNAVPNAGDITIYTGTAAKKSGGITAISAPSTEDYFELYQNVPNPALATTAISYNLKQAGAVTLELFDINGTTTKTLVSEVQTIGKHSYSLSTDNLQTGIYFYRLTSGNTFDVKKMVVIR